MALPNATIPLPNLTLPVPNVSDLGNVTAGVAGEALKALQGNFGLLIGGALLIIATFVIFHLFKNITANAIMGIVALLVVKFLIIPDFPLTPLTIIVSALGGLGGLGALLISLFFGWLPAG